MKKSVSMELSEDDLRAIGLWAADCAERVLPLFESKAPLDKRPRQAIEGIRVFGNGGKRTAQLRTLVWAAYAAAREVKNPAATAAARASGVAAGSAYMHPLATLDQAKHLLGPAMYAALSSELATGDSSHADEAIHWAIEQASPIVRKVLQRMPARNPGRTRQSALLYQLDSELRRKKSISKFPARSTQNEINDL